ncbi:MAG: carbamoyltransferase HypF, partial [Polyangiales bacterium]
MSTEFELIRVRGQVQGVGFRPTVARLAQQLGLVGWVQNDAHGVLIALAGDSPTRESFVTRLLAELPPLARVRELMRTRATDDAPAEGFVIRPSASSPEHGAVEASLAPDAAVCGACATEVRDPAQRRHRYAFTSCTHCGPRFSVARALPWDRARTSMLDFALCPACATEYAAPLDRRYHAEPIACPDCGPRTSLVHTRAHHVDTDAGVQLDDPARAATLLRAGAIVALKGLGGYQLLVDATCDAAVRRLRARKQRPDKPFALMARDLAHIETYCELGQVERDLLQSASAPIVLLRAHATASSRALSPAVAPMPPSAAISYGFMLPSTPLHLLLMDALPYPVVCTSGNRSHEPPALDDAAARAQLSDIADCFLSHDRPITHRLDDSVARVIAGRPRVLRRARGYAPTAWPLPPGFAQVATQHAVLATGADSKAAFCFSRTSDLVLSPHLGELDDAASFLQFRAQIAELSALFQHQASVITCDAHPEGRSAHHAHVLASAQALPCEPVAHHHAHFAACLGEHAIARDALPHVGLVLDGIGAGDDGTCWGGEVLVGNYGHVERRASLRPVPLLGGDRAAREPWRCLYAQLRSALDWNALARWHSVPCVQRLRDKPTALLDHMLATGLQAPPSSSCGRLFDAVAAALGLCFEQQTFEAQAAQALEASVTHADLAQAREERARG